ncbi:MAG: hypothetical protein AMXMBFR74_05400 [Parvibaculum sp.]
MARLVRAVHVFVDSRKEDVDGPHKAGHDGFWDGFWGSSVNDGWFYAPAPNGFQRFDWPFACTPGVRCLKRSTGPFHLLTQTAPHPRGEGGKQGVMRDAAHMS